ncbi:MAG TPA: hypothetical protein VGX68_29355 [Thermoanaerobaculia bacterium]|nr:hypothetical protein [Thermoanaerobaculia bacterium]
MKLRRQDREGLKPSVISGDTKLVTIVGWYAYFNDYTVTSYVTIVPYTQGNLVTYLDTSLWPDSSSGELLAEGRMASNPGSTAVNAACATFMESNPGVVVSVVSGQISTPDGENTYYFFYEKNLEPVTASPATRGDQTS